MKRKTLMMEMMMRKNLMMRYIDSLNFVKLTVANSMKDSASKPKQDAAECKQS
jgi:hypothetical protein